MNRIAALLVVLSLFINFGCASVRWNPETGKIEPSVKISYEDGYRDGYADGIVHAAPQVPLEE